MAARKNIPKITFIQEAVEKTGELTLEFRNLQHSSSQTKHSDMKHDHQNTPRPRMIHLVLNNGQSIHGAPDGNSNMPMKSTLAKINTLLWVFDGDCYAAERNAAGVPAKRGSPVVTGSI